MPVGAPSFREAVRMMAEIFHAAKKIITEKGYGTTVGDEGGYAPKVKGGNEEALSLISESVKKAGYELEKDIVLALDGAASEFLVEGKYVLAREDKNFHRKKWCRGTRTYRKNTRLFLLKTGSDKTIGPDGRN